MVRRVSEAARKVGLKFGIYLSPWDRHEPRYQNSAEYDGYYIAELQELAANYGGLVEFWLDGAGSEGHVYNFPPHHRKSAHRPAEHASIRRCSAV